MSLTDKQIKALKPEEKTKRYFDGDGLYLEVAPSGGKWWRLKYRVNGVEKRISLGTYPEVSLLEARDKTHEHRKTLRAGQDPSVERRRSQALAQRLFIEMGKEWFEKEKASWKPHHAVATESRLKGHIYPRIGSTPIEALEPPDILALCRTVMKSSSTYMAHVVLSLCSRIFRYGIVCGYIKSDPCRDLSNALPSHKHKPMAALIEPKEITRLMRAIDGYDGDTRTLCALKLLPMLMCRTGELRFAEWDEFDFEDKLWRIPGSRMKMGRDHLVPLPKQAIAVLEELKEVTGHTKYLLPGRRSDSRVMSENTVNAALRYMGFSREEMTGHGFRSLASTRLNEMGFRADIIEKQLAHEESNTVRKAYNRAEYLDERRDMLQRWADYLDGLREKTREE